MIQRIQSVYLLLGAAGVIGLLFINRLWASAAVQTLAWFGPALLGLGGLVALVAIGAIFLYKNRPRQRSVIVGLQVLTLLFVLVLYAGLYLSGTLDALTGSGLSFSAVLIVTLPVVAYLFFFLARRGVEKDIKLIRSMDRLR